MSKSDFKGGTKTFKVPQYNLPKPKPPKTKMIVCTTDGKPLHPDDQKALKEYIDYRIKRGKKKGQHHDQ